MSRGGKRLRPALTLATSGGCPPRYDTANEAALRCAAAIELLHCATLVHDDVIDGSARRHGMLTINAGEGLAPAVLTGDLLIAAANMLAAQVGAVPARVLAGTLAALCRGEALQQRREFCPDVTATTALTVARLKTGSLLAAACVLGGHCAGYRGDTLDRLATFGIEFGVALQLVDDLLDVVADGEALGKPVAADFTGGTVTLVGVAALQRHPELRELLHPDLDEHSRLRALRLLRCEHALRATRAAAHEHAARAAAALQEKPCGAPDLGALARWPLSYVQHQLQAATFVQPVEDGCGPRCAASARDAQSDAGW